MAVIPTAPEAFLAGAALPPTFEVVRHVVDFLQWRFSKLPAGGYQWRPEDGQSEPGRGQSEIVITADTPIDPVVVGQRPAITVLRGPGAFNGVGINDRAYVDMRTGAEVKMDLFPTHIMVNVLSILPMEAERLAWFATEQIWTFREEITQTLPHIILSLGQRPSIAAPSPAGSLVNSTDHEWSVVVCGFPAYLHHSTTKLPLNRPIISGASADMVVRSPTPRQAPSVLLQGTAINQPQQSAADREALTRDPSPTEASPTITTSSGPAARGGNLGSSSSVGPSLGAPPGGSLSGGSLSGGSGGGSGGGIGALPQEGGVQAESSEPLTVTIKT